MADQSKNKTSTKIRETLGMDLGTIGILLLASLAVVDFFTPRALVENLRKRLIDYWIFVEGLPASSELEAHVRRTRLLLKKIFPLIVIWLAAMVMMAALVGPVKFLARSLPNPAEYLKNVDSNIATLDTKIQRLYRAPFHLAAIETFEGVITLDDGDAFTHIESCQTIDPLDKCKILNAKLSDLQEQHDKLLVVYQRSKSERPLSFLFSMAVFDAIGQAVFGGLLLASFCASFIITLMMLKSLERARLAAPVIIACDVVLAILIPAFALTAVMILFAFALMPDDMASVIYRSGDGLLFDLSIALYSSISDIYLKIFPIMGARIFALSLLDELNLSAATYSLHLVWFYTLMQVSQTFSDIWITLQGKWTSIDLSSAQRNWTIVASLAVSLFYLLVVAFMIAAKRSSGFRYVVATTLQNFAEHPKGPLGLGAILAAAIIGFLKRVFGG